MISFASYCITAQALKFDYPTCGCTPMGLGWDHTSWVMRGKMQKKKTTVVHHLNFLPQYNNLSHAEWSSIFLICASSSSTVKSLFTVGQWAIASLTGLTLRGMREGGLIPLLKLDDVRTFLSQKSPQLSLWRMHNWMFYLLHRSL